MAVNYDELSKQIIDSDSQIRFAGVVNNKGVIVAGGQKENIERLLSNDDVKMSIHYAIQKRELYTNLAHKIGPKVSSISEYGKVTMISIPINSSELFLVSTEPRADYLKIIDHVRSMINSTTDTE